jgi:hypothetical protein
VTPREFDAAAAVRLRVDELGEAARDVLHVGDELRARDSDVLKPADARAVAVVADPRRRL